MTRGEPTVEGVDVAGMREYLSGTPVVFALLFGSRALGTGDEFSDVDVAVRFPDALDDVERFRLRNRIDADLQQYADGFVDVSDVAQLPTPVAHAALRDGVVLVGDDAAVERHRERVVDEYRTTAEERERERQAFVRRLAEGDV